MGAVCPLCSHSACCALMRLPWICLLLLVNQQQSHQSDAAAAAAADATAAAADAADVPKAPAGRLGAVRILRCCGNALMLLALMLLASFQKHPSFPFPYCLLYFPSFPCLLLLSHAFHCSFPLALGHPFMMDPGFSHRIDFKPSTPLQMRSVKSVAGRL